ncbi:MAG: mechanosensitive ion channel family protein [Firmicutes bacterium]|nr:mechanosensitive ion channel family protein [Bacillota bacterium]
MKVETVLAYSIKIFISFVILLVAYFVIKFVAMAVRRGLSSNKNPYSNSKTLATVSSSLIKYILYFATGCIILSYWGVNVTSLVAIGGVASLSLGIGAQDLIKDMLTGFFILTENQFAVGDIIKIDSFSGKVESIGLRTTVIRSMEGDVHIIPNGTIKAVTNMSKSFNNAVVDIGIAYEEDIDLVIEVLEDELSKIYKEGKVKGIEEEPKVLGVEELGDSQVTLRIMTKCTVGENWQVQRELKRLIKKRLDRENIEIPFPQRTVSFKNEYEYKHRRHTDHEEVAPLRQ